MHVTKNIAIIGAGIAGMDAAIHLSELGHKVTLLEKEHKTGGNLANWDRLFPSLTPATEILDPLQHKLSDRNIDLKLRAEIESIKKERNVFLLRTKNYGEFSADAVLVTTGFKLFNAEKKEEFGYGIYDNVITSADLEELFKKHEPVVTASDKQPKRIGMIHCVGSRDEKSGNTYCSKVCCITGVKQAIELKQELPATEIFCFYIDLRMYGPKFEELYREAQEKWGVQFIRGRVSEASENMDGSIQIKAEDTLAGRPIKMNLDLMVLLSGMVPSEGTKEIMAITGMERASNNFVKPLDEHMNKNLTATEGLFVAGACTSPMSATDAISDARSAVAMIHQYLMNSPVNI